MRTSSPVSVLNPNDSGELGSAPASGTADGAEFFFGTNPLIRETNSTPSLSIQYDTATDIVAINFNRAHAALNQPFNLQYSTNLMMWMPTSSTTLQMMGSDNLYDWLRLLLPAPAPAAAFFQMQLLTSP